MKRNYCLADEDVKSICQVIRDSNIRPKKRLVRILEQQQEEDMVTKKLFDIYRNNGFNLIKLVSSLDTKTIAGLRSRSSNVVDIQEWRELCNNSVHVKQGGKGL